MSSPTICILAAGKGTRLGSATTDLPKSLLEVGGVPILDHQLTALRSCGIADQQIIIVTGHAAHRLQDHIVGPIRVIQNDHFHDYNNIYSVHLLAKRVGDDMVLINGDTLFPIGIVQDLLECTSDASLVIDSTKQLGDEEMKALYVHGRMTRIGKDLEPATATGEYIGLLRMRETALRAFFAAISDMIDAGFVHDWYEAALNRIASEVRICMTPTQGRSWIEIDTPDDAIAAEQMHWEIESRG